MSPTDLALQETIAKRSGERVVNDFSIQVATVNGSGSQTANLMLLRSIFQMGVPVSGKNMFPSNIAGLPTWFTIRANKHGYIGRKKEVDFLVAMNPEPARERDQNQETRRPTVSISFEIPQDIEQQLRTNGADLNGKAREAFLIELYREEQISHAQLREALGLSFHEVEQLIKERGAGHDLSLEEFEAGRELLRKARPR